METFEVIKNRRSIRKYKPIPLNWDDVAKILDAAHYAPTSGNQQCWKFIVVQSKKIKEEIAKACFEQTWIETAPVIIVVCSDIEKMERAYGIRGKMFYAVQECAAAVENALLTAESIGISTCWVGAFDDAALHRILEIPDKSKAQAVITLGYADEKVPFPGKIDLRHLVYFEKYGVFQKDLSLFPLEKNIEKIKEKGRSLFKK